MKIDICSPDLAFLHACRTVLEDWCKFVCVDTELTTFEDWRNLTDLSESKKQCLLFLDADNMDLPQELQYLETLRDAYNVFFVCSRDSRKAIALYRLRPTAFLGKPLSAAALDRAMSRCVSLWQNGLRELKLTESRSRTKLPMCDILWAETSGRSCMLHCLCRDLLIGETMNELVAQLPEDVFIRCQRSYLVNLHHVKSTDGKFVYMSNGEAVAIGRNARLNVTSAVACHQARWNRQME